ncbi:hypothetical protein J6590_008716 [Homalodisca vitripennis]|nr:hypothetical protein J6590_008716 [Homalodisca vitripennis]
MKLHFYQSLFQSIGDIDAYHSLNIHLKVYKQPWPSLVRDTWFGVLLLCTFKGVPKDPTKLNDIGSTQKDRQTSTEKTDSTNTSNTEESTQVTNPAIVPSTVDFTESTTSSLVPTSQELPESTSHTVTSELPNKNTDGNVTPFLGEATESTLSTVTGELFPGTSINSSPSSEQSSEGTTSYVTPTPVQSTEKTDSTNTSNTEESTQVTNPAIVPSTVDFTESTTSSLVPTSQELPESTSHTVTSELPNKNTDGNVTPFLGEATESTLSTVTGELFSGTSINSSPSSEQSSKGTTSYVTPTPLQSTEKTGSMTTSNTDESTQVTNPAIVPSTVDFTESTTSSLVPTSQELSESTSHTVTSELPNKNTDGNVTPFLGKATESTLSTLNIHLKVYKQPWPSLVRDTWFGVLLLCTFKGVPKDPTKLNDIGSTQKDRQTQNSPRCRTIVDNKRRRSCGLDTHRDKTININLNGRVIGTDLSTKHNYSSINTDMPRDSIYRHVPSEVQLWKHEV